MMTTEVDFVNLSHCKQAEKRTCDIKKILLISMTLFYFFQVLKATETEMTEKKNKY